MWMDGMGTIVWMRIMEDVFQMEGKECEDQERLKM